MNLARQEAIVRFKTFFSAHQKSSSGPIRNGGRRDLAALSIGLEDCYSFPCCCLRHEIWISPVPRLSLLLRTSRIAHGAPMPCQLEPIGCAILLQHRVNNFTPEYCNFYWNASQYTSLYSVNLRFCQSLGAFPLKYNPHAPHSLRGTFKFCHQHSHCTAAGR